ncbi:hypothetical protein CONPUDRAFT_89307 [Coniophora puteana RWD-64-598 SS2]|uniref:Uncharacterized protein n=1 Tax=Coniophora puteana (strain RWD-64-598) TaxID=741705 RepID=A0A5M3MWE3_CONPW|nr:uncharacterized protein CONPUDRAFT_89307 [Coniophora puteana RWD-64-598 SS2]EIW83436.1 hypothetical protein CONPUDRAFT_89307 [Coniophora puteana RWD-64-598 SS2]
MARPSVGCRPHFGRQVRYVEVAQFQSSNPSEAEVGRYEAEIGQKFSSEPLAADPSNRCVPIYDVLYPPNE